MRQRLESRAAVEYCEKVTLYLVCFHHTSTFCTTLPGCRYVCEFTRACVFAHHEVPAGLGHRPSSSGIETKTASVGTDSALSEMRFFSVYAEQLPMRLLFSDGSPASASGKPRCRDHVQLDLSRLHKHQW